jgi:hemerythrin superfamily protein
MIQIGQNDWIVYRHIRLDKNIPFYIGIGKDTSRPRNKKDRSNFWKNIIGKTKYIVEILFDNLTKEQAIEKEKEFIKLYGRIDLKTGTLCNMTCGGEGTGILNDDLEYLRRKKIKH